MASPKPEAAEIVDLDNYTFTPISDKGTSKNTAISVELYAQQRIFHLFALEPKKEPRVNSEDNFIDLSALEEDDDDVKMLHKLSTPTRFSKRRPSQSIHLEKGACCSSSNPVGNDVEAPTTSKDPDFLCEICYEHKTQNDEFPINCAHVYCKDCMVQYVASKLQENITTIPCPVSGCEGSLEPQDCLSILPGEVFDRWCSALCEAAILGSQKFYCPYKDCSALLINDDGGGEVIRESECPNCRRLFCAQCKVPWHSWIGCEEFQRLNKDEREREDVMLVNLAKNKRWKRCPKCRIFVEKITGCEFMRCRCGTFFCYDCGTSKMQTDNHYCTCKR